MSLVVSAKKPVAGKMFVNRKAKRGRRRKYPFPTLVADRTMVKLRYSEMKTFNIVGTTPVVDFVYRGNCHTDPNQGSAGAGVAAYGSYIWGSLYQRATCHKSAIKVKLLNDGASTMQVTLFPSNENDPIDEPGEASTRARRRTTILNQYTDSKQLSATNSTATILGQKQFATWNYQTNPNVEQYPAANWFWHIVPELVFGTGSTMIFQIDIDYYVTFSDRKQDITCLQPPATPPV